MTTIKEKIYLKAKSIIEKWNEQDIYAISFFVESGQATEYNGEIIPYFAISYNTEKECGGASKYSEERWNYAFWLQNENPIIDAENPTGLEEDLLAWYKEKGVENLGEEDDDCYDRFFRYIGKGPKGHYELLTLLSEVAEILQNEGFIESKFGKKIPIILHGLEYAWYDIEATKKANKDGQADVFIKAAKKIGLI